MNEKPSNFLAGNLKPSLTQYDLFDRVINLKLTCQPEADTKLVTSNGETVTQTEGEGDVYLIRSDFEIDYFNQSPTNTLANNSIVDDKYVIRKCRIKPSIKVQYKQVSHNTGIEIDIFVSNFFMTDKSGKFLQNFSNTKNKLTKIQLQMGYYGQFLAFFGGKLSNVTKDELFNFRAGHGVNLLTIEVDYVTTDKLPPDSVLHIHGYVGSTVLGNAVNDFTSSAFDDLKASPLYTTLKTEGDKSSLEEMFFTHITRRFRRDGNIVEAEDGLMAESEAKKEGVQVYCTQGVRQLSHERLETTVRDSIGNEVPRSVFFRRGKTAINTFNNMNNLLDNSLMMNMLPSGDFVVFLESEVEDVSSVMESLINYEDSVLDIAKQYENTLPAVYSVNFDGGLATIVAPFFYFIAPFQYVYFRNRYALSDLVKFYTSEGGLPNQYWIIHQYVSFATVEDVNEMTLLCVAKEVKEEE